MKSRMPLAMRYAALIARKFLQEKSVFDIFEGCGDYRYEFFDKISEIKKDVIYAKPFYGEMTKIGVIPEKFLAVMKMDTTLEAKYKELNDFPYTSINNKIHDDHKTDVDIIFDRWDESPSTRMELQNINQP
ncbi:MAG TPA: hypothetical protein VKM55_30795 [Candidatus Lokiarchaeia archaeon]|nr:hypothetical protein [Candidatus Lokiarchaeia archaeon]